MAKLLNWIREASTKVLDPAKDERIAWCAREVEKHMAQQRGKFDFHATAVSLEVPAREVPLVAERTYELALRRAWRDRKLTPKERKALDWIASSVDLEPGRKREIEERLGRAIFEKYLANAMSDGILDEEEGSNLRLIAEGMGKSTRELMVGYFSKEGEAFLRGLFAQLVADGDLSESRVGPTVADDRAAGTEAK